MHQAEAPGWLADLVVPISYAPKGGDHYTRLCRYKTDAPDAAVALRLAGARPVAVVVLGRHVDPADPRSARLLARMEAGGYDGSVCAVHDRHRRI